MDFMKRAFGKRKILDRNVSGVLIQVDWECPYCQFENPDLMIFTRENEKTIRNFVVTRECSFCDKEVSVECKV